MKLYLGCLCILSLAIMTRACPGLHWNSPERVIICMLEYILGRTPVHTPAMCMDVGRVIWEREGGIRGRPAVIHVYIHPGDNPPGRYHKQSIVFWVFEISKLC